jgi:RNA polymerase sigma-70 factor, ECF subfamily
LNNFETIYKENFQKMFCIAQKMISDKDASHDILQDVFIYYYQKSQNGYKIEQPKSWLIRATINKCIDYSSNRKRFTKIESLGAALAEEDAADKNRDKAAIALALSKLKPKEKAMALLYSEGLSYKEISEVTGIRFSSVGKTLSRTLIKLNDILKKMNYEMSA